MAHRPQRFTRAARRMRPAASLAQLAGLDDHPAPRLSRPGAVLLARDALARDRVVYGHSVIAHAIAVRQADIDALVIEDAGQSYADLALLDDDARGDLAWLLKAADALRNLGLALSDIALVLGLSSKAVAQRLVILAKRPQSVIRLALESGIDMTHLRYLTALPDRELEHWLRWLGGNPGGRTVKALKEAMRRTGDEGRGVAEPNNTGAAEIDAWAERLGRDVGTQVSVQWPDDPARRSVALDWYTVEDLQGVFFRLTEQARIKQADGYWQPVRRKLVLAIRTSDEADALFGNLGSEKG